jgi:linoleoyl-CoA desaturase
MPRVTFKKEKQFFNSINIQVENYFKEHNLKKTGNKTLYFKSILLIASVTTVYILLLTLNLSVLPAIALCCLFGLLQATIGFNVMHDANHGSFSEKRWVNSIMSLTANMMGSNAWFWKQKHNIIHHTYTNVDGMDEDIGKTFFLRMCPSQKQRKMHRYQYLYCLPLYTLASIMMFISDFTRYFEGKILGTSLKKMALSEHFLFWTGKITYAFLYIVLPSLVIGFIPTVIGFIIMHATLGLALSVVFQLAHVVEITHFVDAREEELHIEDEWAIHQVLTTADFATNNKVLSWFTGGLNFQVEHHLFPRISHVHYPVIHEFVKKTCNDFSVRFNSYPSMTAALRSHLQFMKQLGAR